MRRLIFIAAHELKLNGLAKSAAALTSPRLRGPQAGETGGSPWSVPGFAGRRAYRLTFALFDPLKSFDPDSIWDSEQIQWHSNYDTPQTTAILPRSSQKNRWTPPISATASTPSCAP